MLMVGLGKLGCLSFCVTCKFLSFFFLEEKECIKKFVADIIISRLFIEKKEKKKKDNCKMIKLMGT